MGPTTLFTHLKIILLQCFQFSVFSFSKISSIQTDPNNSNRPKGKTYEKLFNHSIYGFLYVGMGLVSFRFNLDPSCSHQVASGKTHCQPPTSTNRVKLGSSGIPIGSVESCEEMWWWRVIRIGWILWI